MASNCGVFLQRQLEIIQPSLVITLGGPAYGVLRLQDDSYSHALCRLYTRQAGGHLFPAPYDLLVWPHPSPLSRWLNDRENARRLEESFATARPFVQSIP